MGKVVARVRQAGAAVSGALDRFDSLLRRGLDSPAGKVFSAALWALMTGAFFFVARGYRYDVLAGVAAEQATAARLWLGVLYGGLFGATLAALQRMMRKTGATRALMILMGAAWAAALLLRIALSNNLPAEFESGAGEWALRMREEGFSYTITDYVGVFFPPYQYVLYLIGKFCGPVPELYLVKWASALFEYLCAYGVVKLVGLQYRRLGVRLSAAMLVLLLPTVLMNGAYWGQYDAMYVSLMLLGLYLALTDKPWSGVALFGAAFAIKMQAVFILPILLVLFGMRKIGLRHLLAFPAAYLLMMLPAMLADKPLIDILDIYAMQIDEKKELVLSGASIYRILPIHRIPYRVFSNVGIYLSMGASAFLCGALYLRAKRLTTGMVLTCALVLAIAMPLLLPTMRERNFYLADMLAIVFLMYYPRKWFIPCMVFASSSFGYLVSLMRMPWTAVPYAMAVLSFVLAAGLATMHLVGELKGKGEAHAQLAE